LEAQRFCSTKNKYNYPVIIVT